MGLQQYFALVECESLDTKGLPYIVDVTRSLGDVRTLLLYRFLQLSRAALGIPTESVGSSVADPETTNKWPHIVFPTPLAHTLGLARCVALVLRAVSPWLSFMAALFL